MLNILSPISAMQSIDDTAQIEQNRQFSHRPQHKRFEEPTTELQQTRLSVSLTATQQRVAVGNLDQSFAANIAEGNSAVYSLATQPDGKFLVGGNFSAVNGERRSSLERFNADGSRDAGFNAGGSGANDSVYVINVLPGGKILISGSFTTYNNQTALRIARLNSDGTLDTAFIAQGTSVNGGIQDTIIQPDGKILISGSFTLFNGIARNNIARLNGDGTLDTIFNPNVNGFIEELVLQPDGKIVIGGTFTLVGGFSRNSIARLNSDGTFDSTFNTGSGVGGQSAVFAAERQADGKILIGGIFTDYNGVPRQNAARLNLDGSLDPSFNPGTVGSGVEFFAIQSDGKILVAGAFSVAGNAGLIRLNADGTYDSGFAIGTIDQSGYVVALQSDGKILLGGLFNEYGGTERYKFVRLSNNGTPDNVAPIITSDPYVRDIVQQPDGKILVGGIFRRANGGIRRNVARFNQDGTLDASFDPANNFSGLASSQVLSIELQPDGKILVGGFSININGNYNNSLVRLNSNGSLDTSFSYFNAFFTSIRDIETRSDGKILIAGAFLNDDGTYRGLMQLNSDGSYDSSFPISNANFTVNKIEFLSNGKFLIGGGFTSYSGVVRNRIARINADGSLDATFDPGIGANSSVFDVALLPNEQIYVGGFFSSFNGLPNTSDIVRLNSNGSVDPSFSSGATGFNGGVYTLSLETDGKILAGGNFISYNGIVANKLALLNTDGTLDGTFASPLDNNIGSFVYRLYKQADGKTLVGGFFTAPRNALFRLKASNQIRTLFDYDGDGKADVSVFRPSSGVWFLQRSQNGFFAQQWGASSDLIAPADFDGDGKTDLAVFRPSNGAWFIVNSTNSTVTSVQFGATGDLPRPADFDADGKADICVFRPSVGVWYRTNSSNNSFITAQFGQSGDAPQPADFDGDAKADLSVFRASNGTWFRINSFDNTFVATQFGQSGDFPTAADFDGDGRADVSVFRPSNGTWYRTNSQNGQFASLQFGAPGDQPTAADYDGDGKTDIAVFRSSNGVWYQQLTGSGFALTQFGQQGDAATPAAFIR